MATNGELSASGFGVVIQLSANLCEATRLVLSQRILNTMKLPLMEMQYHVAPAQLACLMLATVYYELRTADDRAAALASMSAHPSRFALAATLGLVLQVVGLVAVQVAGSVAVKLLGIARGAGLVLYEVLLGSSTGDRAPNPLQLGGYMAAVGGFVVYTVLRFRLPTQKAKAQ